MNRLKMIFFTATLFAGFSMSFAGHEEDSRELSITLKGLEDDDYRAPDTSFTLDGRVEKIPEKVPEKKMIEIEFVALLYSDSDVKEVGRAKALFPEGEMPSPNGISAVSCPSMQFHCTWEKFEPVTVERTYTMSMRRVQDFIHFKVEANDKDCGTTYGSGFYKPGDYATIVAKPKKGCVFEKWDDGNKSSARYIVIDTIRTITAFFKKKVVDDEALLADEDDYDDEMDEGLLRQANKPLPEYIAFALEQDGWRMLSDDEFDAPQFLVSTKARNIQVSGARVGASYEVMDMQGRSVLRGRVDNADFSLAMPRLGSFMLRIGDETQMVTLR